jgi:pimeloyl-ACP methyl ester carboxylesterase/lysophospholipase L1-like esterase
MLGPDFEVVNFGVSGSTLLTKNSYAYRSTPRFEEAKQFKPNIVLIKLGTNDSKEKNKTIFGEFEGDLTKMVEEFQQLESKPEVILLKPVPVYRYRQGEHNDTLLQKFVIPAIEKVARVKRLRIVDINSALRNKVECFPDKLHPNEAGYKIIAKEIFKTLKGVEGEDKMQDFPGRKLSWNGFDCYYNKFGQFNKLQSIIVVPEKAAPGKPWIFRPNAFGVFANADAGLLKEGWHIVYLDLANRFGSKAAEKDFDYLYNYLTKNYGFSQKVALEGLSRGGLFALSWASSNPQKVASIYLDAPVCDVRSWPGEKQPELWNTMLAEYKISEKEVNRFMIQMIELRKNIAEAKIPVLIVAGDADTVVPYQQNGAILRQQLEGLGASVKLILKPGIGHHPHGLKDSTEIVEFIKNRTSNLDNFRKIMTRNNLDNARFIFTTTKKGRVAFLGGSITQMAGWRNMMRQELQQRFPETEFDFIDAGIGSTGTNVHAFRYEKDVLKNGKVDLLFVEAAVNDNTNTKDSIRQIRGMEGIVRQALLKNPNLDIVMLHFVTSEFFPTFEKGLTPSVILNHEKIAEYYRIPSINLAQEIFSRIKSNEFTWEKFGGIHPLPYGHQMYRASISRLLDTIWSTNSPLSSEIKPHYLPNQPLDEYSYFGGNLINVKEAKLGKNWSFNSAWTPKSDAKQRDDFKNIPMIETYMPGSKLKFKFTGKVIGIYTTPGPDMGIIEYKIDNGEYKSYDLFTSWSSNLYIPWLHILEDQLEEKKHTITIRLTADKNKKSKGSACYIYKFATNNQMISNK